MRQDYGGQKMNLVSDHDQSSVRDSRPELFNLSSNSIKLTSGVRGGKYA
jgi:hypothetical protein